MKALQANEQFVREQNILLEQKVAERTSELRQSNAQLHQEIAERKRVEATLRQLEKAIETTEVGITITDNDGRIVYTNPADARMHGYTVDELIGQHANIFAPSEHRENKSRTEEEIKEFSLWKRERLNIRKDGSVFPVMLISNPISDHQGHSIGKVIVCEDITEFQQVEKALTEERNLLRTLIDTVPDYIYVKDTESRFLLANTTSAYSIGFSTPDEFVGKTDFDILPYKLAERFYADEQAIMKSGQPLLNQEEPNVNQETGKACWFSTTKAPFRNGQGKIAGIVGISRDITEHKQAKEMLQQRNRELSLINQVNRLFSSSIEWNHVLETVLRSMRRLLNITATSFWLHVPETGELICQQSIGPESEMVIGWRLALGQGIVGQAAQTGETIIIADTRADPQHCKGVDQKTGIELRSILSIPFRVKGEVSGVLSLVDTSVDRFSEDDLRLVEPIAAAAASAIENARLYMLAQQEIAERKQAEEALLAAHNELKEKNAQLQELNASKDKFFSIISHDLRSPFTALLGFAQLLAENVEHYSQDKIKHHIDRVYTSAERLHALLENLLTWARIQRGVMKHHPEPIDLSDIAEDNTALFASRAEQKQITLRDSIPKKTSVYADYSMIDTVLRNLISNALKFSQTDGIIEISAHSYETYVEVAVSDTGTGIRQENIPKLFRIDMQYTNVGTAGETGTGLGLILCQELVERNGGRIWVESDVGKGTTFRFTLPQTSVPV
jgi:PAS domain S-box-containing protein